MTQVVMESAPVARPVASAAYSFGTYADVAERILRRAAELRAGLIVIGPESRNATLGSAVAARIAARAPSQVIVLNPSAGALGQPIPATNGHVDAERLWGTAART
jgi:hypothetical protein